MSVPIEAARHLAAVVESSDDAIITKDLNSIITSWNPAATRMFGYTEQEAIGKSIRILIPAELQSEEDVVLAKIRSGGKVDHYETIRHDYRRVEDRARHNRARASRRREYPAVRDRP